MDDPAFGDEDDDENDEDYTPPSDPLSEPEEEYEEDAEDEIVVREWHDGADPTASLLLDRDGGGLREAKGSGRSTLAWLSNTVTSAFLPAGYPDSVSEDYLDCTQPLLALPPPLRSPLGGCCALFSHCYRYGRVPRTGAPGDRLGSATDVVPRSLPLVPP